MLKEFTELADFSIILCVCIHGDENEISVCVATAGNPDILLVDEVIGVGDGKFMQKAE